MMYYLCIRILKLSELWKQRNTYIDIRLKLEQTPEKE